MNKWIKNALGIVGLLAIAAVAYYLSFALNEWGKAGLAATASAVQEKQDEQALSQALIQRSGAALDQVTAILQTINQSCDAKDAHGLKLRPGTLCVIQKESEKVADLVVTSQRQEKDVAQAAESNMAAVNGMAAHADQAVDALADTAKAATAVLKVAADPDRGVGSVLTKAADVEGDLDTAVKEASGFMATDQVSLQKMLTSTAVITDSGAQISVNMVKISDKATKDYLAPWYKKLPGYVGDLIDIGAAGARLTK